MGLHVPPGPATFQPPRSDAAEPATLTLGDYLAAVAGAVRAGLPAQSWIEATVAACKAGSYGFSLQLVDPAGGAAPAQMRGFLRHADRDAIAHRLGLRLAPADLVGLTVVLRLEPEFHPKYGMGGRIVDLARGLRDSLLRIALEKTRATLKAERLYDAQRRLPRPVDVTRVTVVHPAGAAGHADVAGELARWERAGIVVVTAVTAAFEGARAAADLVAALARAAAGGDARPDIILVVRGGGDKAGLLALDDERVARAVCACPVPIIAGLGHATDATLLSDVAWAACDTPSKAVTHLAGLIAGPARRAQADRATVLAEAERRVAAAGQGLDVTRHGALAGAKRRLAMAAAELAEREASTRAAITGAGERCSSLEIQARRLFEAVVDRVPLRLSEAGRTAQRLGTEAMAAAGRRLERADDGRALIEAVSSRASARLDATTVEIDRRFGAVPIDAARRLTDAGLDLARLASLAESLGLGRTLGRGYAVATTADGRLVPTRAAAIAAARITLTFVDGIVAARVDAPATATDLNGKRP